MLAAQQRPFDGIDPGFLGSWPAFWARSGSYGRSSPLRPSGPLEVIDEVIPKRDELDSSGFG